MYIIRIGFVYIGDTKPCLFSMAESFLIVREIVKIDPNIDCSSIPVGQKIKYTPVVSLKEAITRSQEKSKGQG